MSPSSTGTVTPTRYNNVSFGLQALAALGSAVAVVILGVTTNPPKIETSLDPFMDSDVQAWTMRNSFLQALEMRSPDYQGQIGMRLLAGRLVRRYNLYLVYEQSDGSSITSASSVGKVLGLERKLRALPGWKKLCGKVAAASKTLCDPGLSFPNYLLPSRQVTGDDSFLPTELALDGGGRQPIPDEVALSLAAQHELENDFFPFLQDDSTENPTIMRSTFRFDMDCCAEDAVEAKQLEWIEEIQDEWKSFLADEAVPLLKETELSGIKLRWSGDDVDNVEVMGALWNDVHLVWGALATVALYLSLHTRSVFLALVGVLCIGLPAPLAYVIFSAITSSSAVSVACFLATFLVVAWGPDSVLIFHDLWQQSVKHVDATGAGRLSWTYREGLQATVTTNLLIVLPFLGMLISPVRPVREFGFFMAVTQLAFFALVTVAFLPCCIMDEQLLSRFQLRRVKVAAASKSVEDFEAGRSQVFGKLTGKLYGGAPIVIGVTVILVTLLAIVGAVTNETSEVVPTLLPTDHPLTQRVAFMSQFSEGVSDANNAGPPMAVAVCGSDDIEKDQSECPLFWCDARRVAALESQGADKCQCFRKEQAGCGAGDATIVQTFVGITALSQAQLGLVADFIEGSADSTTAGTSISWPSSNRTLNMTTTSVAPIMMQEWLTGSEFGRRSVTLTSSVSRVSSSNASACDWEDLCFCDHSGFVCNMADTWKELPAFSLTGATAASPTPASRRLQFSSGTPAPTPTPMLSTTTLTPWSVPKERRAVVQVASGLTLRSETELLGKSTYDGQWSFSTTFEVRDPWAQRDMYSLCVNLPTSLRVVQKQCWIEHFRTYVEGLGGGHRFPVPAPKFDDYVKDFSTKIYLAGFNDGAPVKAEEFLWFRDGTVKAMYMAFQVDVDKTSVYWEQEQLSEYQKMWDDYVHEQNGLSMEADAFHTSELWLRLDVKKAFVEKLSVTLTVTIILTNVIVAIYSRSIFLMVASGLMSCVAYMLEPFAICALMGTAVGPIEVMALLCFIGYTATLPLLIAQQYGNTVRMVECGAIDRTAQKGVQRYQRVFHALKSMGAVAAGGAFTTALSMFFLSFTSVTVFRRMGAVGFSLTLFSGYCAVFLLPAMLMAFGPKDPGFCQPPPPESAKEVGTEQQTPEEVGRSQTFDGEVVVTEDHPSNMI
eukprot:TRINITY_DN91268_c0_g1_i1.p1 TRINITY_DN91268_c0_g1~~TRINITY_DN91268_c0_g1_i1.p1  ORF type:complete len:1167 (+),score=195.22 TRINITY_DN91268_c0_g1_i1:125-3625(+)